MLPLSLLLGWPVFLAMGSCNGFSVLHEEEKAPVNSLVFITFYAPSLLLSLFCKFVYYKDLIKSLFSTAYTYKNVAWIAAWKRWWHCRHDGMTVNGSRPDELLWNCYFFVFQSVWGILLSITKAFCT